MFKKGSFEIGGTIYPVAMKVEFRVLNGEPLIVSFIWYCYKSFIWYHYKFKACKNEERLYIQFLWIFIVYILSLVSLDRKSTIDRQVIDTCIDNW